MATSSILGGDLPNQPSYATGTDSLGPSDSTDSGSDTIGTLGSDEFASDSDRHGTGERATIESNSGMSAADILPDHVEALDAGIDIDDRDASTEAAALEADEEDEEDEDAA